jgi:hypothetical protein
MVLRNNLRRLNAVSMLERGSQKAAGLLPWFSEPSKKELDYSCAPADCSFKQCLKIEVLTSLAWESLLKRSLIKHGHQWWTQPAAHSNK